MTDYTPLSEIPTIHAELRQTFKSGLTIPHAFRRTQLLQLARLAQDNADEIAACLYKDLGRPRQEAIMGDVVSVIERALICAEKVGEWMKETDVKDVPEWQKSWKPKIEKKPKGVALIISPWNYPFILTLQPLYGAISAGCPALIKPSEFTPHCSAFLAKAIPRYLDPRAYKVVLGGVPEITKVLELRWDHIFYTGNSRVARIISAAAAKHLTPVTLELGGKSPVIIDQTADLSVTAKRVLWGKINNSGQICVAPDYIIAPRSIVPQLVEELKKWYEEFYPKAQGGALGSDSYGRVVNDTHFERLKGLLRRTKGEVVSGGKWEDGAGRRGIEPTIVLVKQGDALLEDELFGPILPILSVEGVDQALEYLQDKEAPLVLYGFTNDEIAKKKIVNATLSGTVVFGDTFQQVSLNEIPFGGIGESGQGRQVLKYSFNEFSYERPIVDVPFEDEGNFGARYPPYNEKSLEFFSALLKTKIPQ